MKTEDDIRSLLREAAGEYETGLPPTPRVIDLGRRAKKRRVAWLAGLAAACVIAAAAVGGVLVRPGSDPHPVAPIDATDSTVGTETTEPPSAELVRVPAIRGLHEGDAAQALHLTGLKIVVNELPTECSDAEKAVVGQDPVGGQSVPTGSKVYVNVGVLVCGLTAADRRVVEEFEQFAADPSAGGPFAPSVALGLGNELRRVITGADQTDPSQWRLHLIGYAERAGELSVLDLVADNADVITLTTDVRRSFCPTTLAEQPPPQLTGGGHAVRIRMLQPPGACMQLATVDLYVNDANEVVGVNVGLGAP